MPKDYNKLVNTSHRSVIALMGNRIYAYIQILVVVITRLPYKLADTTKLFRTSNFIRTGYHTVLLFSGLGSIVLLFVLLFSQPIREDLVIAAFCACPLTR